MKKEFIIDTLNTSINLTNCSTAKKLGRKRKHSTDYLNNQRCSICLDHSLYTDGQLLECLKCSGKYHSMCIINKDNNWECNRCIECKTANKDLEMMRCLICNNSYGIMCKLDKKNFSHYYCIRFIHELFTKETQVDEINITDIKLRKWREKNKCKICYEKKGLVIKCSNTKCKFTTHVDCAIDNNLILPIDFMMDFYNLEKNKISNSIPFYCAKHNRNLIIAFKEFKDQLNRCLGKNRVLNFEKEILPDMSFNAATMNIANLSHPEFNYNYSTTDDKIMDDFSEEFYKIQKPQCTDDSFNISLENEIPEFNMNMNEDFSIISRLFYDYYEKDMRQIGKDGRSSITISELKDLKEFLKKVISSYKEYDTDFNYFYKRLSSE